MYTVRNISTGPRGFYDKNTPLTSGPIMLDKGASAEGVEFDDGEREAAEKTGFFEITKSKGASKSKGDGPQVIQPVAKSHAEMTEDELRAELKEKLGDLAPADADRETMLGLLAE